LPNETASAGLCVSRHEGNGDYIIIISSIVVVIQVTESSTIHYPILNPQINTIVIILTE